MPRRFHDDDDDRPVSRDSGGSGAVLWLALGGGACLVLVVGGMAVLFFAAVRAERAAVMEADAQAAAELADEEALEAAKSFTRPVDGGGAVPGLVAHWPFDAASNDRSPETTGKADPASLVGCRLGPGRHGSAVVLRSGADEYADLGRSDALSFPAGRAFTVAGWVRAEADGPIVSFRSSTRDNPQIDLLVRGGKLLLVLGDDTDPGNGHAVVWGKRVMDGDWHHFAFGREGTEAVLYVDGELQGRRAGTAVAGPITTDLRAVGSERRWAAADDRRWGPIGFSGAVDDVRVYHRMLTDEEAETLAGK